MTKQEELKRLAKEIEAETDPIKQHLLITQYHAIIAWPEKCHKEGIQVTPNWGQKHRGVTIN